MKGIALGPPGKVHRLLEKGRKLRKNEMVVIWNGKEIKVTKNPKLGRYLGDLLEFGKKSVSFFLGERCGFRLFVIRELLFTSSVTS